MVDLALGQFVQEAFAADTATWDEQAVRALATKVAPPALGGTADWLLRGDANSLWARWFLEGLADPQPYLAGDLQYAHLFKQIRDAVSTAGAQLPADEQGQLSRSLSKLLWREIEHRAVGRRVPADRELRLLLWDLYPRCWICGAAFSDWARAVFFGEECDTAPSTLPFVDFYKPRGTLLKHLRIEVEHVVAHSGGGADDPVNLRLACGWCNRAKSDWAVLYDAEGAPRQRRHPTLGIASVPQPFWVVRFLAMRGRCEDPSGCQQRTSTAELTVAARNHGGSPNPANLMVVCHEHDPMTEARLVAARYVSAS